MTNTNYFECMMCGKLIRTAHIQNNLDHVCQAGWRILPRPDVLLETIRQTALECDLCGAIFAHCPPMPLRCLHCLNAEHFTRLSSALP